MCSVIEIKNSNEYYIHYHSPDSMEPDSLMENSNNSNDDKKANSTVQLQLNSDEQDCSVLEITQSPPTICKDPEGKTEEVTSDKGSSLEEEGGSNKSLPANHCLDVPITVNSHIPSSPARHSASSASSTPSPSKADTVEMGTNTEEKENNKKVSRKESKKEKVKRKNSSKGSKEEVAKEEEDKGKKDKVKRKNSSKGSKEEVQVEEEENKGKKESAFRKRFRLVTRKDSKKGNNNSDNGTKNKKSENKSDSERGKSGREVVSESHSDSAAAAAAVSDTVDGAAVAAQGLIKAVKTTSKGYVILGRSSSASESALSGRSSAAAAAEEEQPRGALTSDLRQYLNTRFPKGGVDHELQNTIRDNLYLRTVPVTTRPKRPEERNGTDYTFLSKDEFIALEKSGELLESGIYDGNHYGTPKPSKEAPASSLIRSPSAGFSGDSPSTHPVNSSSSSTGGGGGAHPSSEGKRRRNRSNVEAMTAKHFLNDDDDDHVAVKKNINHNGGDADGDGRTNGGAIPDTPSGSSSSTTTGKSLGGSSHGNAGVDSGHPDSPDVPPESDNGMDPLGPLPPNWEKAYTDKGEAYFIDHNSGTSHWLDPRLSRVQKKRPEECAEDELPFGWERIDDPHYGTYFIDHVNRRTQYENPVLVAKAVNQSADPMNAPPHFDLHFPPSGPPGPSGPPPPQLLHPGMTRGPPPPGTFPRSKKAQSPFFTRDPNQLRGDRLRCQLVKSSRGLGFTIVGGDDNVEEFLQIKSVVPNGPAWMDGGLITGDVLVYVNDTCVLGFTHHDMVTMFQSISTGEVVNLEVCRGYPLPFDPDDPNTEIVTTVAVTSPDQGDWASELERQRTVQQHHADMQSMPDLAGGGGGAVVGSPDRMMMYANRPSSSADLLGQNDFGENGSEFSSEVKNALMGLGNNGDFMTIPITKGGMGFGFTIADSGFGQKVKKILDRPRCKNLQEGDVLIEIDHINVRNMSHGEVVQVLKDCPRGQESNITIQRGLVLPSNNASPTKAAKYKKEKSELGLKPKSGFLFRSKTPTADMYSAQEKEKVPNRPKTPLVNMTSSSRSKTPTSMGRQGVSDSQLPPAPFQRNDITRASLGVGGGYNHPSYNAGSYVLADQMSGMNLHGDYRDMDGGGGGNSSYYQHGYSQEYPGGYQPDPVYTNGYPDYNAQQLPSPGKMYGTQGQYAGYNGYGGHDPSGGYGYSAAAGRGGGPGYSPSDGSGGGGGYRSGSLPRGRKESTSFEHSEPLPGNMTRWPRPERRPTDCIELTVTLLRHDSGFGFRIVGGTEEGSQVSIGHIVPGGAADVDGRLFSGDEIVAVDGSQVLNTSHHQVVSLMGQAANGGRVTLTVRRRIYQQVEGYGRSGGGGGPETYPYEVTVTRRENEGFGFVIISSVSRAGSTIGRIIPGSPAERCGRLHIGDRILAVNHVDINHLHHGDIVNLIKDSGYSVVMTVGSPIDDTSSTASTSHRSSTSSMVTAQALPTVLPPTDSAGSTISAMSNHVDARSASVGASYNTHHFQQQQQQQHQSYLHQNQQQQQQQQFHNNANYSSSHFKGLSVSQPIDNYQQEDQELNMLELDDQYYAVELQRGARGFGFSIRGGREFHSMPLFVLRIAVDGPAAADGRLRVGDQIIEINGINTKNMTHGEAIELIKSGGSMVRLLVRRGKMPPAALMEQVGFSPLSPTPVPGMSASSMASMVASASAGRPMSAMSQPTTMIGNGNYAPNGYPPNSSNNNNGNGMVPTPFTQTAALPNGGLNGPVGHSSPRVEQYYWNSQYHQQQH